MLTELATRIGIRGYIAIGLALALSLMAWRANSLSNELESKRDELAGEKAAHQITRRSVDTLQEVLEKYVGAQKAARIAQLASVEKQAKKSAAMRERAAAIRAEIDSLEADDCRTPDFVMER